VIYKSDIFVAIIKDLQSNPRMPCISALRFVYHRNAQRFTDE
jgi:hypothetical protein